jgi:hypothetical protein
VVRANAGCVGRSIVWTIRFERQYRGNLIAVGAITQPGLTGQSGAAYVFASQGGAWNQTTKLVANDGQTFDNFGFSISNSGRTVFVGSSGHTPVTTGVLQAGSAYVFQGHDGW